MLSILAIAGLYELCRRRVGSFAGSHPFGEGWTIQLPIDDVKSKLTKLHQANPKLFRDTAKLTFTNSHSNIKPDKERIDFYYADRNEDVKVIFRQSVDCKKCTKVSLISFTNRKDGTMRLMNRDFNWFANQREIKTFEERILKYIK